MCEKREIECLERKRASLREKCREDECVKETAQRMLVNERVREDSCVRGQQSVHNMAMVQAMIKWLNTEQGWR